MVNNICQHNLNLTAKMQSSDLTCMDCNNVFKSAALLLQHFADHVVNHNLETDTIPVKTESTDRKSRIPNLYPINRKGRANTAEADRGSDSGIEDINPLRFCLVTMEENKVHAEKILSDMSTEQKMCKNSALKKYQCTYCLKRFGWSTDLKRHILTHTGERPFQCLHCNSSFTRNFLLQNHQRKLHFSEISKTKLPDLKPIGEVIKKKLIKRDRKQQKGKIKRKKSPVGDHETNYLKCEMNRLLCSS